MYQIGKVKNNTPKQTKKVKRKKKKRLRKKATKQVDKDTLIDKNVERFEEMKYSKQKKANVQKTKKKENKEYKKKKKELKEKAKEVLQQYNKIFKELNLHEFMGKEYDSVLKNLQKKEAQVLFDGEARKKIVSEFKWKEKNFKNHLIFIANILLFPEFHEFLEQKISVMKNCIEACLNLMEEYPEMNVDLVHAFRSISNLSQTNTFAKKIIEANFVEELFKFLRKLKKRKKQNDDSDSIKKRIEIEISKLLSNLSVDINFLKKLKSFNSEDIAFLIDLTRKDNETIKQNMSVFWFFVKEEGEQILNGFFDPIQKDDLELINQRTKGVCTVFEKESNKIEYLLPNSFYSPKDSNTNSWAKNNMEYTFTFPIVRSSSIRKYVRLRGRCHEPIIYFYSNKEVDVSVDLNFFGEITESIPPQKNWTSLKVLPNEKILDSTNKTHPYLFYEGDLNQKNQIAIKGKIKHSFIVEKMDLSRFFNVFLDKVGMNKKETNDFISFWKDEITKQMENARSDFIRAGFIIDDDVNAMSKIDIKSPTTKKSIDLKIGRLFMVYEPIFFSKSLYSFPQIENQKIISIRKHLENESFYGIEWGGMLA